MNVCDSVRNTDRDDGAHESAGATEKGTENKNSKTRQRHAVGAICWQCYVNVRVAALRVYFSFACRSFATSHTHVRLRLFVGLIQQLYIVCGFQFFFVCFIPNVVITLLSQSQLNALQSNLSDQSSQKPKTHNTINNFRRKRALLFFNM